MPGSGQFPTCIYGTRTGCLGVVASLSHDKYCLLEKLQPILRDVVKSTGGLSHQEWRSCLSELEVKVEDAENFLDGDLIESFLDPTPREMESVSSAMVVPVKELEKTVQDLKRLLACHALPVLIAVFLFVLFNSGKSMSATEVIVHGTLVKIIAEDHLNDSAVFKYLKRAHARLS
ncbi:putative DNA repair protein xp-E [Heracleum sosnowskyi]|uniref:DNA repair protein xp-E n=1 Tax=Heracleum sosnowskyi TaxID=360622 RepID=A0AAD8LXN0_9APIA|nr:putative DNA repair protein xp-E [Heracleum sosnowskyi]